MGRALYPTVDDLLAPATLGALTGRPVATVRRRPFQSVDSLSGSRFLAVETDAGGRYVLKRIAWDWDWIMRATDDRAGRSALAWQTGLLDRLPPEITAAVLACARDGAGWAILMEDVGAALVPPGDDPIAAADNAFLLEAMAAMHASFWGQTALVPPAAGFCALAARYREFAPAVTAREAGGPDPIPPLIGQGWALLEAMTPPDVAAVVRPLLDDPGRLCAALERLPGTVVHGDWKLGNLGLRAGPPRQVVLLDWAVVGPAPPGVDLAWYLAVNSARLPVAKEAAIAHYRAALADRLGARLDEGWWRPGLALSLLGGFLQLVVGAHPGGGAPAADLSHRHPAPPPSAGCAGRRVVDARSSISDPC
jgi:hypothetical protein